MDDFDDGELLQLIADRESDEDSARDAYSEFYSRHMPWLLNESNERVYRVPGRDAEGFALDVLTSVFESKAKTFTESNFDSREDAKYAVRAWLGRIAENRLADFYRVRGEVTEDNNIDQLYNPPTADNESAPSEFLDDIPEPPSPEVSVAARMIKALDERKRVIVLTYLRFQEKGKRIPSEELQSLADEFNTTSENVRKIYLRFRDSVRKEIDKMQQ